MEVVNWIMECITIANFVVLINGCPSPSFFASRGLHQGCTLSPLLFLLMVESLSLLIHKEKHMGRIRGIRLSSILSINTSSGMGLVLNGYSSDTLWTSFVHLHVWLVVVTNLLSFTTILLLVYLIR